MGADPFQHMPTHLEAVADLRRLGEIEQRARQYGIASFARDVLAVADTMDRALKALDAELQETANPGVKALLEGVGGGFTWGASLVRM